MANHYDSTNQKKWFIFCNPQKEIFSQIYTRKEIPFLLFLNDKFVPQKKLPTIDEELQILTNSS